MAKQKLLSTLNKGVIIAVIVSALSFLIKIVPCKTSPVIAEPVYKWSLCKIPNPFKEQLVGLSTKFYGFTTEPLAALITTFLVATIIVFAVLTVLKKKQGKVVDLTEKNK